jgi:ferredoxin
MSFFRVNEKCNGCLACVQNCPANALDYKDQRSNRKILHNMSLCARCGNCWRICPEEAIEFQQILKGRWDEVITMELVHCMVCGEPVYTTSAAKRLSKKLDRKVEALCSDHKKKAPLSVWKRVALGRGHQNGETK